MTYRQEILKPFYDHLISLGFKEKKFGIAIAMLDRDGLRRLPKMTFPKIQNLQFHKQITDDLIDVIAVTVEGTATTFELSVTLAVIIPSFEQLSADLLGFPMNELGAVFTVASDLIKKSEPMIFAESNRDADRLQVSNLVDMTNDIVTPYFSSRTSLESLLPDLKAGKKSEHPGSALVKIRYVDLPLALVLLGRPEEALDHLANVEQKPNSVYGNMAGKLKNKFPDMF